MVTPLHHNRRFLAPGDKLGKYELIRQIAVGGMAELYLARTVGIEGFEKLVCVKRILPQYVDNPSFVNMFLNEARLAATLHHPNITQVYDIGQEAGEYFFTMEYVHGEDLGQIVVTGRENGVPISLDAALTLVAGLCAGLHYAHEKAGPDGNAIGIVHRDVSPTNVLVSYDGAVKLVDFGIARAGSQPSTTQGGLKGKIAYMSPEQCRGKTTLDRRSDVFSVGTILYELTTGQLPFTDETEYGVLNQIVNEDAAPPSKLVSGYPAALEAIVMRALARDPEQRHATALDLQHALEDFAHETRLRVSPLVLARLMSTLFPARLEEWDHARAQGAFFVEQHVVRTLIESGKTADSAPKVLPPTLATADGEDTTVSQADSLETGPTNTMTLKGPLPVLLPPREAPPAPTGEPGQLPGVRYPVGRSSSPSMARVPAAVPNQPGAVPIVLPLLAPPIAQGGTLVSSSSPMLPPVAPAPAPIAVAPAAEITERVRISTPVMTRATPRRSRLPVIVVSAAGALGAMLAVVLVTRGSSDESEAAPPPSAVTAPAAAPTAPPSVTPAPEPPKAVAEPAAAPPPPAPTPDPPKAAIAPPVVHEAPVEKKPKPARARPSHVTKTETKPKKPDKPKAKEQPWNDDSPFMPVRTDKH